MKGFKFAGIKAGIKKKDLKDLGLIYCDTPATAAALFTRNKVVAAPVILGRRKMAKGQLQAILVNSGNANCFTAQKGIDDAEACCRMVSGALGMSEDLVLVSSTGVIGAPLPLDKFESGVPEVVKVLSADGLVDFATAILTTDTRTKIIERKGEIAGQSFTITGVAKGSGMIRPDMATMLAFVLTDVQIDASALKTGLTSANEKSFNRITVDGDTSTNDSLFALASGAGGVKIQDDASIAAFQECLDEVCLELAREVVRDGEGATKLVSIEVKGAATQSDAFMTADAIAHSNLVKTAVYGQDPNWGRIMAAAGRAGADVVQEKMDLWIGDLLLVEKGQWLGLEAEKKAAQLMKEDEIAITLDLNLGEGRDILIFCDFSENYVKINADYRT